MFENLRVVGECPQGTMRAIWIVPMTIVLSGGHQERMELIQHGRVLRKSIHDELLNGVVGFIPLEELVPGEDTSGIGIDDKNRLVACIEQDGIRRFGADALELKELPPQRPGIGAEHAARICAIALEIPAAKRLQADGLLSEIPCRADEGLKAPCSQVRKRLGGKPVSPFELVNGAFHVVPRCRLG